MSLDYNVSEGVVTLASPRSVAGTLDRLLGLIGEKGLRLFAVVDHSGEANKVGLAMPETKLVIFGSPVAGTPVMIEQPLVALDLPLKVLVSEDAVGGVSVSYSTAEYLTDRHHLSDEACARLEPVEAIARAAVSVDISGGLEARRSVSGG